MFRRNYFPQQYRTFSKSHNFISFTVHFLAFYRLQLTKYTATIPPEQPLRRRVGGHVTAAPQIVEEPTTSNTNNNNTNNKDKMHHSGNNSPNITNQNNNMTYGMTPEQASREFDILRREATKLERHLEDRVARYQQVSFIVYVYVFWC